MAPIWAAIGFLIAAVTSMVSYLLVPIILFLEWLIGLIPFDFSPPGEAVTDFGSDSAFATLQPEEFIEQVPDLVETSQRILPFLIMLFVVLLVSLALGRLFQMARRTAESDSSSISPMDGFTGLESPGLGRRLLNRLGFISRWRSATSIRRIYQAMSDTAAEYGYPRSESETPYEYLETLAQAWPNSKENTVVVTEAYVRVRYGEIPETEQEMNQIVLAWDQLKEDLPSEGPMDDSKIDLKRNL
jgi:hypothetical protein